MSRHHPFPSVESMHAMRTRLGHKIRVWRDRTHEPLQETYDNADLDAALERADEDKCTVPEMLVRLNEVEGVSAVEITDAGGKGVVACKH